MSSLAQVIFYSLIGGVLSLVGGFLLHSSKKRAKTIATFATPFAAGALLAAAFIDLLPEAAEVGDSGRSLVYALIGILTFFLLERFLRWFHHHHDEDEKHTDPTTSLVVFGDIIHNFIDGIAIAAGFLVDPSTGIVVTLAVAAHEIPQEIGDFGLLLGKGLSRRRVLFINLASALVTTLAAVFFFQFGRDVGVPLDAVLGLVAGFFIYIAVSDIIPLIHKNEEKVLAGPQTALLLAGALIVGLATTYLHGFIDAGHDHDDDATHSTSETHSHEKIEYEDHETLPALSLSLVEDEKSGFNLKITTQNFTFSPDAINGVVVPGQGHAHLYVNDKKITRIYSPNYYINALEDGDEVRVTLNADNHAEYTHDGVVIEAATLAEHDEDHAHDEKSEAAHGDEHDDGHTDDDDHSDADDIHSE